MMMAYSSIEAEESVEENEKAGTVRTEIFFRGGTGGLNLFQKHNLSSGTAHTADHPRSAAELAKLMRNAIIKTTVVALAASLSILGLSTAWFASNTKVTGADMQIAAGQNRVFWLATRKADQQGVYDSYDGESSVTLANALIKYNRIDRNDETTNIRFEGLPQLTVGSTEVTGTDGQTYIVGDSSGISLMVNSESNVNNIQADDYVGPGSKGMLTFYVIPTVDGENRQVQITVSLAAYKLTTSAPVDNTVTATAQMIDGSQGNTALRKILSGHILLFRGKDPQGNYTGQIFPELSGDGTVDFTFLTEDAWVANQPIAITLYWIWPLRFENLVYAGQSQSVFQTAGSGQEALLEWVNQNKDCVVFGKDTAQLENAGQSMSNGALFQWSGGYNRGDQLIGNTAAYLIWTINAAEK